jgi:hypothetical protein
MSLFPKLVPPSASPHKENVSEDVQASALSRREKRTQSAWSNRGWDPIVENFMN